MLEPKDGLFEALKKIGQQHQEGGEMVLTLPKDSPLLNNLLTLRILKKEAKKLGIELELQTDDLRGQNLLTTFNPALPAGRPTPPSKPAPLGFQEGVDVYPAPFSDEKGVGVYTEAGQVVEKSGRKFLAFLKSPTMKKFLLFSAVGFAGLGVIFAILWTVPKATIRLTIRSEALVQSFELTASPSATTTDASRKILPAVLVEVEEKGEQKAEASGKKEKGTRAEGEMAIYNWTDDAKTFAKEEVVTLIRVEGDKLRFLLDEELTVPAQTASVSATPEERTTTYTPGKETVRVTAEKVGGEYNIEADEEFSIAGLSTDEFLAQNSNAFEGGKKEDVQIVTSEDQNRLLARLKDELEKKASEDIKSRTVGDQKLNGEAVAYEILGQTFDKEIEEEAEEFTLNLRLKGSALVYSQTQLDDLVAELLAGNVPEDFDLSDKELVTEVSAAKMEEGEDGGKMLQIIAKTKASVISKVDENRIKEDLIGRSLESAQKYLESIPGVSAVEITVFPPLPGALTRMPRLTSRIEILSKHD